MGEIKKMLAMETVEPRTITARQIWTDLCENVHLHFRNLRLDFSEVEFAHFRAAINALGMAVEKCAENNKYREGNPNFLIQQVFNAPLDSDSDYYPDRVLIELQKDNTVHFHYRDLRVHLTRPEFAQLSKMFARAGLALTEADRNGFPYKDATAKIRDWIDIGLIQPYDDGHRALCVDQEHKEGIEVVKRLISKGYKIRPILVNTEGQRLDGFKRYMAHWEFGLPEIECIVDPYGVKGGQHNQSFIDD